MSVDLHLRITTQEDALPMHLFKGHEGLVIAREKSGTPDQHYHAYVQGIKKATLDTRVKKLYKGNDQYSNRVCKEPENQLRYLFKGTKEDQPCILVNTLDINVEEKWKEYWQQRKAYQEIKKESLKRQMTFVQQLLVNVQEKITQKESGVYGSTVNIIRAAMELSLERDVLPPNDNRMLEYVEYVQLRIEDRKMTTVENKIYRVVERLIPRNNDFQIV